MLPRTVGEFRVATEPELRFTPSGLAVCNFRAVASSRKKEGDEWVDDKACWLTVTAFKDVAENIAESVEKGFLVVIDGRLQTDDWEDNEGNKRTKFVLLVDSIGPALKFQTARVSKLDRRQGSSSSSESSKSSPAEDPWATPAQPDEPPF